MYLAEIFGDVGTTPKTTSSKLAPMGHNLNVSLRFLEAVKDGISVTSKSKVTSGETE
jgi:hypothetical protein